MPSIRSSAKAADSGSSTHPFRLSALECYGDLRLATKLCLMLILMFCLSTGSFSPFAHATKDYVVPVGQSERRMPTVTVTASRSRGGGSGLLSISMSGGGFSPFGAYTPFGDEYFFMSSCNRRRDDTSDLCKNICRIFPDSPKCPDSNKNKLPIPDSAEEILPPVTVSENKKKDDRKKLNLLNYSGPPALVLEPVEAVVPCIDSSRSHRMNFPIGTHRKRSIVSGEYYKIRFREEKLYKLVREAVDEMALPGKDGIAIDWKRGQEGGFYIYWNRITGNFRIGEISEGNLYEFSVNITFENDKMNKDEIRIGVLHTQPSSVSPSFHDIYSTKHMIKHNQISQKYAKDFIATVKIDSEGKTFVELRMYDFVSIPLTDKEILEGVQKEIISEKPNYPYILFDQYSVEIDLNGSLVNSSNGQANCG